MKLERVDEIIGHPESATLDEVKYLAIELQRKLRVAGERRLYEEQSRREEFSRNMEQLRREGDNYGGMYADRDY